MKILSGIFLFVLCCIVIVPKGFGYTESVFWNDNFSTTLLEADGNIREQHGRNSELEPIFQNPNVKENGFKNVNIDNLIKINGRGIDEGIMSSNVSENIQKMSKEMAIEMKTRNKSELNMIILTHNVSHSNVHFSDIAWMMRIFNLAEWNPEQISINNKCGQFMKQYLEALQTNTLWATKMNDASGRYTSQFFFGNDFWLGSQTMCSYLHNEDHQNYYTNVPPFPVHFFVAKLLLKIPDKFNESRAIKIGLCLPQDCSILEIKALLQADVDRTKTETPLRSLSLKTVRAVPGSYSVIDDNRFHLLMTILIAVISLIVMGTYYEISLARKEYCWLKRQNSNNSDKDIKISAPLGKKLAFEMKLDNVYTSTVHNSDLLPEYDGKESIWSQFILCFSAMKNSKMILHVSPVPEGSITCVHGLRFYSLLWIIMVHTYLQVITVAENKNIKTLAERNFMFQTVSNASFSVDTFFFISGLLVAYLYLKSEVKEENNSKNQTGCASNNMIKFFKLVGYRFLRLTPAYMFVLLIAEISMRWIQDISVFEPQSQNHISCRDYWWRNILYINSLYPMEDMCMLWSWYVSNDTQFYILGIIILLFSSRYFKFSVIMFVLSLLASWIVTITISLLNHYRVRIDDPFSLFDQLYDKPWTRLGPYLIGISTGWFLIKTRRKLNLSTKSKCIYWFLSIFILLALVYGLKINPLGEVGSSLYVSIGHTAWALALAWIVVACCSGHGGFINTVLSYKLLHPLSRLTYCAYLIHPIIMTTTIFPMNGPLHLANFIVVIIYFGNILASFLTAFLISLMFEAPVVRILKLFFFPQHRRKLSEA